MIIHKEEVEKAALEYIKDIHAIYHIVGCDCFIEGAKFVENKVQEYVVDIITENQGLKLYKDNEEKRFKELAVNLIDWLSLDPQFTKFATNKLSEEELYELFKKEKHD